MCSKLVIITLVTTKFRIFVNMFDADRDFFFFFWRHEKANSAAHAQHLVLANTATGGRLQELDRGGGRAGRGRHLERVGSGYLRTDFWMYLRTKYL
jgi:hypothetical protein